ncbi:hypothetical protein LAZ67_22002370 [Cordylochernes scorpioides]|uniref:Uncharacterized protein n=1 Tax=Cordylochernes scorpioides TaxID=51811 RepID=A0ABY6LPI6_9ARAC|nr:hypothetical protein LAZ67_22002370 [Cordylochernes scorpioides]
MATLFHRGELAYPDSCNHDDIYVIGDHVDLNAKSSSLCQRVCQLISKNSYVSWKPLHCDRAVGWGKSDFVNSNSTARHSSFKLATISVNGVVKEGAIFVNDLEAKSFE